MQNDSVQYVHVRLNKVFLKNVCKNLSTVFIGKISLDLCSDVTSQIPEMKIQCIFPHGIFLNNLYKEEYATDKATSAQ